MHVAPNSANCAFLKIQDTCIFSQNKFKSAVV